ncbi:MAG: DUF937 domain-containing protein [Lachnospiraceae bacterium]|nr:DUF937 domain-containing protein [Lachnospiraceae bacterium]
MDLKKLAGTLLSSDSIKGLSDITDASGSDVTKVLTQAIPVLLSGANEQAKDKKTADSFVSALSQHAKDDTKDLSKFMNNVDLKDGSKILTHLLGSDKDNILGDIAEKTGVSQKKTNNILSAIAPLLLSLLGQQKEEDDDKDSGIENLLGSLLSNVDVGDVLTGLLSGNSKDDDDDKDDKKKDSGNLLGSLLQNLLT